MALCASVDFRNLGIQAQLEADLSLAGRNETTDLSDLSEAENDVEEVRLGVLNLDCPLVYKFLHQEDMLTFVCLCLYAYGVLGLLWKLFDEAEGEVKRLLIKHALEDFLDSIDFNVQLLKLLVSELWLYIISRV